MKAYCLFEQSGTFKKEFIKHGIQAEDYDILNDFNQTDHIIDLFKTIERGWNGEPTFFDDINEEDIVIAFFPCIRFCAYTSLLARCEQRGTDKFSSDKKLEYAMQKVEEINRNYQLICKLVLLALRKKFRLIIENPFTQPHFLTWYFPLKPTFVDQDRRLRGDKYKKPTQYWFINCEPKHNFIWEPQPYIEKSKSIVECNTVERSMITSEYANRFIKEFIL